MQTSPSMFSQPDFPSLQKLESYGKYLKKMGQSWRLVNIDRKEHLLNNGGLKLEQTLMGRSLEQLVELIRKPKWIPLSTETTARLQVSKSKSTRSPLLALPQELIDMIVLNLFRDSSEGIIYLSLTCVYFFRLIGPLFQRILAEDSAPWAGNRLVFVGEYSERLDMRGFCTSDEIWQFRENNWHKEKYTDIPLYKMADNRVMCTVDEYTKARQCRLEDDDVRQAGGLEHRVREKLIFNGLHLFNRLSAIAKRPQLSADDHGKHAPVLRNLTAKTYVRDHAIAESEYAYSLGEVVAVFTQWTAYSCEWMDLDVQGEWAGHRFDIATMADVSEDGWTDVSELAVENLTKGTDDMVRENGRRA